jgi:hypothetical protein
VGFCSRSNVVKMVYHNTGQTTIKLCVHPVLKVITISVDHNGTCMSRSQTRFLSMSYNLHTFQSTTNYIWTDLGANPSLRCKKPATNRLSYCTAVRLNLSVFTIPVTEELVSRFRQLMTRKHSWCSWLQLPNASPIFFS